MSYNPHEGHRDRLRDRYLKEGLLGFPDHNILELLLFYAIPRRDTNEIAHALLEHFGSLSAVFDASVDQLTEFEGIGEKSAVLINLIPKLARAYLMDKETRYPHFGDVHKLGTFLVNLYIGETKEKLIVILLNNRAEMIHFETVSEGTVNCTKADISKINDIVHRKNAASFVLAHNHPDGDCRPSSDDIQLTTRIASIFSSIGPPLAEHIVVGGNTYHCILSSESSGKKYGTFTGLEED